MTSSFLKSALLATAVVSAVLGCDRKQGESSVVTIQFPPAVSSSQKMVKSLVTSGGVAGTTGTWMRSPPSSLGDIQCYGVAISGADGINSKRCYKESDNSTVFETQDVLAAIAAGSEISLEVKSGKLRQILIFGFSAADVADCGKFLETVPFDKLSRPYILAQKIVDLEPGTTTIPMTMEFNSDHHFDFCTDSFSPPIATTPTPPTPPTGPPVQGNLVLSPTTYSFPSTNAGSTSTHTITVTNTGDGPATNITVANPVPPYSFSGGSYPGVGGTCTTTLASGSSCTIVVKYSPTAVGTFSGGVNVAWERGSGNTGAMTAALTGFVAVGEFTPISNSILFLPTAISFTSAIESVTVVNNGNFPASGINYTVVAPFSLSSSTCTSTLAPGQTCVISVRFTPTMVGTQNSSISLNYVGDGSTPTNSMLHFQGTGTL